MLNLENGFLQQQKSAWKSFSLVWRATSLIYYHANLCPYITWFCYTWLIFVLSFIYWYNVSKHVMSIVGNFVFFNFVMKQEMFRADNVWKTLANQSGQTIKLSFILRKSMML